MVNFAELKAKAEKVKDAGVTKVTNTRDRLSSVPSSKTNWEPNWKRGPPPPATASPSVPPPPSRVRPDVVASGAPGPPVIPRASRPAEDLPAPPPSRAVSGYPPNHRESPHEAAIDWGNLSTEDKEELFGWLDEFFSRYLGVELRVRRSASRPPPTVNMSTRPQM